MLGMTNVALAAAAADYLQQQPCCKGTTVTSVATLEVMNIYIEVHHWRFQLIQQQACMALPH